MSTTYHAGSIMAVTVDGEGYHIRQVEDSLQPANDTLDSKDPSNVIDVDYQRWPVAVKGKYNTVTTLLVADVFVFGNKLAPIFWPLRVGPLNIKVDLKYADGLITIYLKNDHECWIKYKITAKSGAPTWEYEELMFEW